MAYWQNVNIDVSKDSPKFYLLLYKILPYIYSHKFQSSCRGIDQNPVAQYARIVS